MKNIERLVAEQVRIWTRNEAKYKFDKEKIEVWPVITISREYGAGGRSLARELGERTGFKVWDKELLSAIAQEAGADEQLMGSLDERRRKMIDDALYGTLIGYKNSNTHYYRSLLKVLHTIGLHGKSIIVGRGSNYIIDTPSPLKIRIICPLEKRIANVSKIENIGLKEAEKLINAREDERTDFVKHYFRQDPGNAEGFDLVVNSGNFSIAQLADLVLFAYEKKVGKKLVQAV